MGPVISRKRPLIPSAFAYDPGTPRATFQRLSAATESGFRLIGE